jgi:hypothetical protein
MRRLWPAAVAATALMLGGCDGGTPAPDGATPATGVPTTSAAPAATTTAGPSGTPGQEESGAGADRFVSVVRAQLPEVAADRRDEEIAAVAEQACTSLAAGDEADAVVAGTRSLGTLDAEAVDEATARELVKLAIDTVCPGQNRRVDEF